MNRAEYAVMRSVEEGHWWYRGLRSMLRRSFPHSLPGRRPVVLDAGCGTGANLRLLRELAPDGIFIGLDRAGEALEYLEHSGNLLPCRGDANQLPLADESMDVVFAGDLLGQQGVSVEAVCGHFFRVLKPGGWLLVNVPAFAWLKGEHDLAVHVTRRFMRGDLRDELKRIGFEQVRCRFWNGALLPLMLAWRLISRLGRKSEVHSDLAMPPRTINHALTNWIEWETGWELPIGSSIFATARKP